jgi:undecaprenyl-diphosphatase
MTANLLNRLSAHDRALRMRCAIGPTAPRRSRACWTAITHLGGATAVTVAAIVPLLWCCAIHEAAKLACLSLAISHLVVQIVKRTVVRGRPATVEGFMSLVREPDVFSFPSGHATSSMAVALAYGLAFPVWAAPLLALAMLIGFSRVRLGVHYPSDVLAGQFIALATTGVLMPFLG